MCEENLRGRQNCCRLCLAPDNECIPILNSYAADKEPLVIKISNCVGIRVSHNDKLSQRICHACISYLNSWQSFKNRCLSSQNKQRQWLDIGKEPDHHAISTNSSEPPQQTRLVSGRTDEFDNHDASNLTSSILDGISSLKKRKSLTVYVSPKSTNASELQAIQHRSQTCQLDKLTKPRHSSMSPFQSQTLMQSFGARSGTEQRSSSVGKCKKLQLQLRQEESDISPSLNGSQPQLCHSQHSPDPPSMASLLPVSGRSVRDENVKPPTRYQAACHPLPAVDIKDEPIDEDEYIKQQQQQQQQQPQQQQQQLDESDDMVDPTLFLERTEVEGDEPIMEASEYGYNATTSTPIVAGLPISVVAEAKEASCRACHLKFSTRANARRHERNLHPNLFELSASTPNNMLVTRPTPALAAALELQRAAAVAAANVESPMSAHKFRQEVVNAFNKCETGDFDYDNPEKYQHYLTDEKIVFLQQNEEFLDQYQTMTCRCCNKYHSTYKNFMAHMRKKYTSLPRNLCFNCLKLNDSKALFISHLKRRNCINLYKVLHALMAKSAAFAAAVTATAAAAPEKLRAKELLVNKMYECKLCPKQFRLKLEFRSHVYDAHADAQKKDLTQTQCTYCALKLDDPAERKRHYNNMECIVSLRCVTCNAKFDNHQKFLDHVYERHLTGFGEFKSALDITDSSPGKKSSFGGATSADDSRSSMPVTLTAPKSQYFSRMPQACPICGQQYNNYNNVLRHMESKHPDQLPQTYKCVKCGVGYPRLSNLREHMVTMHAADKARHTGFEYIVNADAVKITDNSSSGSNVYTGRYDYVMKDLMSITNGGALADDTDNENENPAKKLRKEHGSASNSFTSGSYSSLKECPICNAVFSNNIGLSNHMRSHTAAAQTAAAAAMAAAKSTPSSSAANMSQCSAVMSSNTLNIPNQGGYKRSFEQAADRRFRRMRCRLCQRRFSSKKSYRFHMLNDHQIRDVQFIKCKLCDAEFAYEKGLKVHMFKIHNRILKDEMIVKQFECDICSIVYRSEGQLVHHKNTVHSVNVPSMEHCDDIVVGETSSMGADQSGISTPVSGVVPMRLGASGAQDNSTSAVTAPLYWYQCKYCPANFNTNKKLAIHINSHDEFDSKDYSCKDCGNVYSGRKSLWVHRYKKHPQIAHPSECVLCKKVFFDAQMLENHIPTCNRKPITATGAQVEHVNPVPIFKHKTGDDEDDSSPPIDSGNGISENPTAIENAGGGRVSVHGKSSGIGIATATSNANANSNGSNNGSGNSNGTGNGSGAGNYKIKLPEVACTMCGARFTDQDMFAKHIHKHEMELYTDNPLAAMFDTGPADPNQFFLDRVNENGEYACDLCSKAFTAMTALKVHRKWHFRGDSKQTLVDQDLTSSQTRISHPHQLGLQAVGLIPNTHPSTKLTQKRKRELKCEYCPSTFISNNNLRRHIYELHKNEIGNLPQPPAIPIDNYLQCRRCDLTFHGKNEWIEHKVSDARVMKPFGPFQWGCDLCGTYVSRKEKLINHIYNHLKEKEIVPGGKSEQQHGQQSAQLIHGVDDEEEDDDEEGNSVLESGDGDIDDDEEEEYDNENGNEIENMQENEHGQQKNRVPDAPEEYDDVDDDEADADADHEIDDVEEVDGYDDGDYDDNGNDEEMEEVMNVNENANDGQHAYEDDEDDDGDEDDEDDDEEEEEEDEDDEEADEDEEGNAEMDGDDDEEEVDGAILDSHDEEDTNESQTITDRRRQAMRNVQNSVGTSEADDSRSYGDDDDDEEGETEDGETMSSVEQAKPKFPCDLCQGSFESQQELQKHVKMHFLNGPGSVTLSELKTKSSVNKSRSSSSDVVAASSA